MKFTFHQSLVHESELAKQLTRLEPYRVQLAQVAMTPEYTLPESSLQLPLDETLLANIQSITQQVRTPTLQYIIVIGIGGSNLGTQAIYETVAGSMNLLVDRLPTLLFLDTVADEKMTAVTRTLEHLGNKDDFLTILISKSGTTTESIANMEVLWDFAQKQFGDVHERFVCITDEGSKLWLASQQRKITCVPIPAVVGGRFSVFSAVGLLPLSLAGIDIQDLLSGARRAVVDGVSEDLHNNHSLLSAAITYLHAQQGRTIHNSFFFSPRFEGLGKWYRQLVAESLGKDGKGITPIVSIGSTDLHSQAQLYFAGPDDKYTNLIHSSTGPVHSVPVHLTMPGLVADIQGTSLKQIMHAIYGGVKTAYETAKRPFVEVDLVATDAHELGYYLQFRMIEVMYLGKLLDVNTFDQPAVEMYKSATRELLKSKH
jgi:glucose-6-phosphate isomerase